MTMIRYNIYNGNDYQECVKFVNNDKEFRKFIAMITAFKNVKIIDVKVF